MSATGFTYKGVTSASMGLVVEGVTRPILAPIVTRSQKVVGRNGQYWYGSDYDMRQISVNVHVIGASFADLRSKVRTIAGWLFPDPTQGPQALTFDDDSSITYYALLDKSTDITQILTVGKGTLTFICPDPYGYGATQSPTIDVTAVNTITNAGTAEAYPVVEVTFQANSEFLLYGDDTDYILLGSAARPDTQTTLDANAISLNDDCSVITGWNTGPSVEYGVIAGTMTSDGQHLIASAYGAGAGWHGPAVVKSLGTAIQDFEVNVYVTNNNSVKGTMGRVEAYLFDAANNSIGKLSITDAWPKDTNMWGQIRAGADGTGTNIIAEQGSAHGTWNNFTGVLRLKRQGNNWEAYIARSDGNGKFWTGRLKTWIDTANAITAQLASVEVHLGQYAANAVSTMNIDRVEVKDLATPTSTQIPLIAHAGDIIEIDHLAAVVRRNGVPHMDLLDPTSKFFSIPANGSMSISFSPADSSVETATMSYTERWL